MSDFTIPLEMLTADEVAARYAETPSEPVMRVYGPGDWPNMFLAYAEHTLARILEDLLALYRECDGDVEASE